MSKPIGTPGPDTYSAGWDEADTYALFGGNDYASGGGGDDRMYGGADDDTLNGDSGNDYLAGGSGEDKLSGGDGNDDLYGGLNDEGESVDHAEYEKDVRDVLEGGAGDDHLWGMAGDDVLTGGAGCDVFYFAPSTGCEGSDQITDFRQEEGDKISLFAEYTGLTGAQLDTNKNGAIDAGDLGVTTDGAWTYIDFSAYSDLGYDGTLSIASSSTLTTEDFV